MSPVIAIGYVQKSNKNVYNPRLKLGSVYRILFRLTLFLFLGSNNILTLVGTCAFIFDNPLSMQ